MKLYFVHGAGSTAHVWDRQLDYFSDAEGVQLPGHPQGAGMSTMRDYATWLHELIVRQEEREPVLVGHSMGGGIVLQYALQYPDQLKALVLVSTGARLRVSARIFEELEKGVEAATDFVLDWALSKHATPETIARSRADRLTIAGETVRGDFMACDGFDVTSQLGTISVPTLILCGAEDVMTPTKYAESLHSHIQGSTLRIIPEAGHLVMVEQPDAINEAISGFVSSLL